MNTRTLAHRARTSLAAGAIALSTLTGVAFGTIMASAPAGASSALPTSLSSTSIDTGGYTNAVTGAPVRQQGATTQTITDYFNAAKFQFGGSATVPEGWSLEYTCNHGQSWDALSYYGCVNGVRTVGDLTSLGLNAGAQVWQGSQLSGADGPSRIQLSGGGDGWTAVLSPDGTRVFNVYHHGSPSQVDCHIVADGTQCPGFRANTHWTTNTRSSVAIVGTQLYMAGGDTNVDGFTCINFDGTSCGNPTVISGTHTEIINSVPTTVKNAGGHNDWCGTCNNFINEVTANGKVLAIDTATMRLGCYDTSTSSTCASQPARGYDIGLTFNPSTTIFFDMSSVAVGDKIYFTGPPTSANGGAAGGSGSGGQLSCFDTDTMDTCAGAWPVASAGPQAVSAAGTQQSGDVCTLGSSGAKCYDSAGVLQSSSSVLNSLLTTVLAPGAGYGGHGNATTIGSRFIWARGGWTQMGGSAPWVECFDTATNAQCPHFPLTGSAFDSATNGAAQGSVYTVEPDPTKANCMWTNDNFANILSWNLNTGTPGCAPPGQDFVATYQASKVFPRLTCNGDSVNSWGKLTVTDVSGSYTQALLTVKDTDGNTISGWDAKPISTVRGVLTASLSGLSPSVTGPSPQFQVKLVGLDSSAGSAKLTVTKTGSAPELCINLRANAYCPSPSAMAAGAKPKAFTATLDSYLDVTTGSGNAPTIHSSAGAHVSAPTLDQCQVKPDPPNATVGSYPELGALKLKVAPPSFTGGAVPNTLVYHYRLNGGSWQTASPDANGKLAVTGLDGNTDYCVEVATENLWGWSDSTSIGCVTTHGTWSCDPSGQRFMINDGQLYTGTPWDALTPVGGVGGAVNALAYNPFDQMLYAVMNGPNQHLVQIASDGEQIDRGHITGLPIVTGKGYVAGDIDPSTGIYYVSSAANSLYAIDLSTNVATPVTIPLNVQVSGGLGADFAIRDHNLVSVNRSNVVSIDLNSGGGRVHLLPSGMPGAVPGAMWASAAYGGVAWQAPRAHGDTSWLARMTFGSVHYVIHLGVPLVTSGKVYDGASCN